MKWVEAGRMLNELSGSLSSCVLLVVFSTLPVQRRPAKDFFNKAGGFEQANQLFPGLCAHFPGGNSLRAIKQVIVTTPQITALHPLGHGCFAIGKFSKEHCCMVLCKSQLFGGNPLLHASFHLRQTDGNTFGRCVRSAAVRFSSLNQNAIFRL